MTLAPTEQALRTELRKVSLDDRYALAQGPVVMTGIQALVRLPMLQRQRDLAAGLNTAGFISGYRGSPLGGLDQALWQARKFLETAAASSSSRASTRIWRATAVWGSQQVGLFPGAKHDGVFALWYGKGPGVDRSLDVLKHGNHAGTARHGGVLVVAGDDHAAKSSTLPHQSDHVFAAAVIPVLNPSGVQDYLDLGIHGWAMSRYSGCWVAFKAVTDTVESTAVVDVDPHRVEVRAARPTSSCRRAACRSAGRIRRWCRKRGCRSRRPTPRWPMPAPTGSTGSSSTARGRGSGSSPPASPISTCARRWTISASTSGSRPRSGCGCIKVGMTWPLEPEGTRALRRGAGGDPGRRGEAAASRVPAQGGALQLARGRPAARHRQVRREGRVVAAAGRLAAARGLRADAGDDRAARSPAGSPASTPASRIAAAAGASSTRQGGSRSPGQTLAIAAGAALLLGLPAQHQHAGAGGQPGAGRHRLPLHGDLDLRRPRPRPSARWAARAWPGSARRRSPRRRTSSPISATAPTSTPASWRSGPRSPPASTSPTRSSTTTPSP